MNYYYVLHKFDLLFEKPFDLIEEKDERFRLNINKKVVMKKNRGFTIIEVVLVLAIAGLIFAMVFIALPSMQRGQRNTQRKRDLTAIIAAMNRWKTHNSGSVTDNYSKAFGVNGFCTFWNRYVGDEMRDPSTGEPYKIALWGTAKAYDCKTRKSYNRDGFDPTANGRTSGNSWAKMQLGDIQYDDVARCNGDTFDDNLGKSANMHAFALRVFLEGGSTLCVDNGFSGDPNDRTP